MSAQAPTLLRGATAWLGRPGERRLETAIDLLLRDGAVAAVGPRLEAPPDARLVDASSWLVLPGFVNAHHHLSQQLTRTRAVGRDLVEWLCRCYPEWSALDAERAWVAARVGLAELLRCGVTCVSDFTYFYPRGHADIFDAQVEAARGVGVRFAPVRGGLVELEAEVRARLGTALDARLEDVDTLLSEAARTIDAYHDPSPASRCRVAVGLTEKAYGAPACMHELAALAERADVRLHTHLHPRLDERARAAELGTDPVAFLRDTGWWGDRLWIAHGTGLTPPEVHATALARVGLCTCPASNARFATPIAPAAELHRRGGTVGIGVDGAASNDGGDFLGECRLAWQVARIRDGASVPAPASPEPSTILEWATGGGARLLGWSELGWLDAGGVADLAAFRLDELEQVGVSDPLAALLLCGTSHRAAAVFVAGRQLVADGELVDIDSAELAAAGRAAAAELARRALEVAV